MAELSKANIDSSVPKKKTQNVKKTSPTKTMSKVGEKTTTTFQKMTSTVGNVVTSDRKPEKSLKSAKAAATANPKNTIKRKFVSKLLVSKSPNNAAAVVPKKIVPKEVAVSDAKKLVRPKKRVSISTTNKVAISFPKQNKPQQYGDEPKPGNSGSIKGKRTLKRKPLLKSSVNGKTPKSKSAEKSEPSAAVVNVAPAINTVKS